MTMEFKQEIKQRIATFLGKPLAALADEIPLRDLVVESFMLIEMVIEVQETFGIRVNQEDLKDVRTVGQLLSVLESKRK
ncbi:MAG TPA: acyl carrier protein [Bdellovibrionota bacterium]|nr:acyl carrier protein [Bdellovibrionota bacterium]